MGIGALNTNLMFVTIFIESELCSIWTIILYHLIVYLNFNSILLGISKSNKKKTTFTFLLSLKFFYTN